MDYTTLISAADLAKHLGDPQLVISDCRHDLMNSGAGARAYAEGHVPRARFAGTDRDLAGAKNGRNGRRPLPEASTFIEWLGRSGVDSSKQVIAYDNVGSSSAARLWWMLQWVGHDRVAVLDGGWEAWVEADLPVVTEPATATPLQFSGKLRNNWVGVGDVVRNLQTKELVLVDARAPER